MGQYFFAINETKKEYFGSWEIGLAKLWEWCVNRQAGVFPYLLRRSDGGGGGDISGECKYAGRWAGDRVSLMGDCDSSEMLDYALATFADITEDLVEDYNEFIRIPQYKVGSKERR